MMKKTQIVKWVWLLGWLMTGLLLTSLPAQAKSLYQIPTGSIPTVTGTPLGPYVMANTDHDQINVRSWPDAIHSKVIGVLLAGQKAPAIGKYSVWYLIEYPGVPGGQGWVYAPYMTPYGGDVPLVEPPPTPTVQYTTTIDPTLAAQFIVTPVPSRLPSFTAPPPLIIPTYVSDTSQRGANIIPMGMIIIGLAALGIFLGFISLIRGR